MTILDLQGMELGYGCGKPKNSCHSKNYCGGCGGGSYLSLLLC
ncbi:SapB/AmfS family lanthipeptide [Streptomyces altiplanensis]